jgi:translation initiation factor IF-2
MAVHTVKSLAASVEGLNASVQAQGSQIADLTVLVKGSMEAKVTTVPAPATPAEPKAPKADVKYRSAKAISSGKDQAKAIWDAHYAAAGVKRFADLTPAQQKAAKAEVAAAWKAVKGTRKTKVA